MPPISQRGGILIMMLVLLIMLLVMMMAGARLIALRYHQTIDQAQREQAYNLAESGIYYTLWLLNIAGVTLEQLQPIAAHEVIDPATNTVIGTFDVTYETVVNAQGATITVTSKGKDATFDNLPQRVVATLLSDTTSPPFKVSSWSQAL